MTQSILVNSARGTLKAKSWPAQAADLNLIELEWDEFDQKVKQPTGARFAGKLNCTIFSLPPIFGRKNAENL